MAGVIYQALGPHRIRGTGVVWSDELDWQFYGLDLCCIYFSYGLISIVPRVVYISKESLPHRSLMLLKCTSVPSDTIFISCGLKANPSLWI